MRIGIDMLGNQSPSRDRGIGRYTRHLISQFLRRHSRHQYFLYHHPGLPGADDQWPGEPTVRVLPATTRDGNLRLATERLTTANPDRLDLLLLTSAFEYLRGFLPPARPLTGPRMGAMLYDLIPWIMPEYYLGDAGLARAYYRAVQTVRQYDLMLAISESSAADCQRLMGAPASRVVNVGAASDQDYFTPAPGPPDDAVRRELSALGVQQPFVYCLGVMDDQGSLDPRKNLALAITAFGRLPTALKATHQFVISGVNERGEAAIRRLAAAEKIESRVVLARFLPDEHIRTLMRHCAAFAFVSRYEGFGLPILEALQCGAPVLAGDNSSQPEIVGRAGLLVNVDDPDDVAEKLLKLLADPDLAAALRRAGPEEARRFKWETTADRAISAIESTVRRFGAPVRPRAKPYRPRIAMFTTLTPQTSPVATYTQRLLLDLRRHYVVDLFHDAGFMPHLRLSSSEFACHDYRLFARYQRALRYHAVVYQLGPTPQHDFVRESLLRYPGIAVTHPGSEPWTERLALQATCVIAANGSQDGTWLAAWLQELAEKTIVVAAEAEWPEVAEQYVAAIERGNRLAAQWRLERHPELDCPSAAA